MEFPEGLDSLFWILLAAAVAPLVVGLLPGPRIPEVVVLLFLGIIIGPEVLDLADKAGPIQLFNDVGLGFLFFIAGYELDPGVLRGRPGRLAVTAWVTSLLVALAVVGGLYAAGVVTAYLPVAIALTSTALGTLLPILRDAGLTETRLGRLVFANGAVGEFGPIIAISLFLGTRGAWASFAILVAFGLIALALAHAPRHLRTERLRAVLARGAETTSQTTVRWTVVLLVGLLLLSARFGLDVILGAFAAGLILRQLTPEGDEALEHKIDGIAFGFFVPLFFVTSGITVDIVSIAENPGRLLLFFALIAVVRGLPVWVLFRRMLPALDRRRLALYSATGLPIIVAVTHIGVETGVMLPENAAALVGAGVLSVLCFPLLADRIGRRSDVRSEIAAG